MDLVADLEAMNLLLISSRLVKSPGSVTKEELGEFKEKEKFFLALSKTEIDNGGLTTGTLDKILTKAKERADQLGVAYEIPDYKPIFNMMMPTGKAFESMLHEGMIKKDPGIKK